MQAEHTMETGKHTQLPTLICIISSAGGIKALPTLLQRLPQPMDAAVIIVQHLDAAHRSRLVEILKLHTKVEVRIIEDGDAIQQGVIHVASPGKHVLVDEHNLMHLTDTDKVQHVRPSGDLLLTSAAAHYQGQVIGIVLTGRMRDGSDGVQSVHDAGGVVLVQDPESAQFRSMPDSAIATGIVDFVLSLEEIGQQVTTILEAGTAT